MSKLDTHFNNKGLAFKDLKFPTGLTKETKQRYKKLYDDNIDKESVKNDFFEKLRKYSQKYTTIGKLKSAVKYSKLSVVEQELFNEFVSSQSV